MSENLAGRAVALTLHSFTLREIEEHLDEAPFPKRSFERCEPPDAAGREVSDEELLRGGLPVVCLRQVKDPALWFRGYEQTCLERDAKMNAETVGRHLGVFEASFVTTRLPPYLGNRASRLIKSPKLYVTDAGLAAHLRGITTTAALASDPGRGALIETFVAQNLAGILEARWPEARLWSVPIGMLLR